jgi:hypothetical protein
MAKSEADLRASKMARSALTKHGFDLTMCDLRVMHGVLHIRGSVRKLANAEFEDVKNELEKVCNTLRQKGYFKDVALGVSYRN